MWQSGRGKPPETFVSPANGGARRQARTSVLWSKTLAQAEFSSAEHFHRNGAPTQAPCVGSYGGPSKEAVTQQIEQIEAFVAERKG